MGILLRVVADTGEDSPISYGGADPKLLASALSGYHRSSKSTVSQLLAYFNLSFEPFTHQSEEEYTLATWMSPRIKMRGDWDEWTDEQKYHLWQQHHAEVQAAYQEPSVFLAVLKPLIAALAANPTVYQRIGIADSYFTDGDFLNHLRGLQREFEWFQERGSNRVRLVFA